MTEQRGGVPILDVRDLNVYYGHSHALQGVNLRLDHGVLSVVGRNGMGKTTLCKAIMGLVPVRSGAISFRGQSLAGLGSAEIARLGIGYVPQGRRLWPSLTVDEHLRLVARKGSAWTPERIYGVFPRLAERKSNGGAQLSGGEQQMLAIGRALLLNPRLLVMDEPTEGLAPVIVNQVAEMLVRLGQEGDVDVLVIEQNIGVACSVAEQVAIMVNGKVNRVMDAGLLAADRDLQQALLGVGRHAHDETPDDADTARRTAQADETGPQALRVFMSNPSVPTRWTPPVPVRVIERSARTVTPLASSANGASNGNAALLRQDAARSGVIYICGTLDTKGAELRFMRDLIKDQGLRVSLVDLSTSGKPSGADVPPSVVAGFHPRGAAGVFTGDRGTAVAGMTLAFERWIAQRGDVAGLLAAGGSGGTALVSPAFRAMPVGVPKVIVSTVASGNIAQYVGPSDITMMHSVADVQGLNSITRQVLANAAHAVAGMARARQSAPPASGKPAIGLTMFGVTTPCVQAVVAALGDDHDCLVFHATGTGGRAMEKLLQSGMLAGLLDLTTTEVCDMVAGGVFPADETRFDAMIDSGLPYIGACGALDMVNFNAPETVPDRYAGRLFYEHNPQITLMRTTVEENIAMGRFIGEKLNRMNGVVRFFLNDGGVSALDAPGQPFWDPAANKALFTTLEETVRQTANRQLVRVSHNINDSAFSDMVVKTFRSFHSRVAPQQKEGPEGMFDRDTLMKKYRAMRDAGEPIIGGGAGTGLSAKCEEAGGIDLIVIYNSGRYRMAGRGSLAGLMPYGDANGVVMEMAGEVLPVVKHTPVLAGVCASDPFRMMDRFLDQVKEIGFSGVQNFPTVGLIDGTFRANLEETGMSYQLEVDMVALAHKKGLLTTPYVFCEADAAAMAQAGADIIVVHLGLTTGGSIGAETGVSLEQAPALTDAWAKAALDVNPEVIVLVHGGPVAMPEDAAYVLKNTQHCHGFYGASSMERLPTEIALTEQTRKFKQIGR